MSKFSPRALACAAFAAIFISSPAFAIDPLQVVVTADRSDVPLKNTGSAITVITSDQIEKFGSKNIVDVLRTVPGLSIAETGGLGGESKVSLRGASPGASMIMLDGVRISDPTNTEGYFDFGNFSAANIERIEILRGPQSALYGSDAMGGVINIITKKGGSAPVREVTIEGGSYGTVGARGSLSGATDKVTYSFGVNALHSEGFPRYGYRIARDVFPYFDPNPEFKNNPVDKAGLNGRVSYRINDDVSVETGLSYLTNDLEFPDPYASNPADVYNSNNHSKAEIISGSIRTKFSAFDGALKNQILLFGNETNRDSWQVELYGCNTISSSCRSGYFGKRLGLEYQGDLKDFSNGTLTFGGRHETESMRTDQDPPDGFSGVDAKQATNSLFAQQRFEVSDRLTVSFGSRVDAVEDGQTFPTWRSTVAYSLDQTATKLRASMGTGAKAPSLFQRFSLFGTPDLQPEKSTSFDFGFDQTIADGRADLSVTFFNAHYSNKIGFAFAPPQCTADQAAAGGCYYNVGQARARGVEIGGDVRLIPDTVTLKLSYTYLDAKDTSDNPSDQNAGLQLYRVPKNMGSVSLVYSGIPKFEFEPRFVFVGERLDIDENYLNTKLPAYVRFDLDNRYKINATNDAYIRFENLTNAQTSDVYNYGSAGRAVYVGWTTRW